MLLFGRTRFQPRLRSAKFKELHLKIVEILTKYVRGNQGTWILQASKLLVEIQKDAFIREQSLIALTAKIRVFSATLKSTSQADWEWYVGSTLVDWTAWGLGYGSKLKAQLEEAIAGVQPCHPTYIYEELFYLLIQDWQNAKSEGKLLNNRTLEAQTTLIVRMSPESQLALLTISKSENLKSEFIDLSVPVIQFWHRQFQEIRKHFLYVPPVLSEKPDEDGLYEIVLTRAPSKQPVDVYWGRFLVNYTGEQLLAKFREINSISLDKRMKI